jgi:hypothetical protein
LQRNKKKAKLSFMIIETICVFSDPVRYDLTEPNNYNQNFQFAHSVCETITDDQSTTTPAFIGYNPTTTISSSSDILVYGSITAGEIIIATLLILAIFIMLANILIKGLSGITTHREYLNYSGGEVNRDID